MKLDIYQVDAFAERVFEGNPAAVCPLQQWLDDTLLQQIAAENNLSETAFFIPEADGFALRWFTPGEEVDLCGHATLAAAHVIFTHLGWQPDSVAFFTRSGTLRVARTQHGYRLDFPATMPTPCEVPAALLRGLNAEPLEVLAGFDYLIRVKDEATLKNLTPTLSHWLNLPLRGVVVTAPGDEVDFVSRCFFPALKVDEDPVTGSAHCELAPYWAARLGKHELIGRQISSRPGTVMCHLQGERVSLEGKAADYLVGQIHI